LDFSEVEMLWTTYHRLVAAWILEKRKASKLTQAQLAFRTGISLYRLSMLERDKTKVTVEVLSQLARSYKILPSEILADVDNLVDDLQKEGIKVYTIRTDITEPGLLKPSSLQFFESRFIPGTIGENNVIK